MREDKKKGKRKRKRRRMDKSESEWASTRVCAPMDKVKLALRAPVEDEASHNGSSGKRSPSATVFLASFCSTRGRLYYLQKILR